MSKKFASHGDLEKKKVTFSQLSEHAWAYTAEGDPNTGIIIGDDSVMVIDTQATPTMAQDVIGKIRTVTDKPIKHVVLSHYHAVRVFGASAYSPENIYTSQLTLDHIKERGEQDKASEIGRFPRLFQNVESIPDGLTWPTIVFDKKLTVMMGNLEVQLLHLGKGHTQGDIVVWVPAEKVLFSGDLVEYGATPYCGDAHLIEWPSTLQNLIALDAKKLIPGRGDALTMPGQIKEGIEGTQSFVTQLVEQTRKYAHIGNLGRIYEQVFAQLQKDFGHWVIFEHCMPFNVSRAFDEINGIAHPQIWTAERDVQMWKDLEKIKN